MVTAGTSADLLKAPGAIELLARQVVQPDTPHRYIISCDQIVEAVRVDVFPDGGMGRFRVWGEEANPK